MLDLGLIEQQLTTIDELLEVRQDLVTRSFTKMPGALIYLISERPADNANIDSIRQQIFATFAVELVISGKNKANTNAQLYSLRTQVRNTLLGLEVAPGFDKITASNSRLLGISNSSVHWVDEFTTSYLISAT